MQLQNSIIALFGLLAAANARPTDGLEKRNSVNDCGDSTFENKSSGGSPLVEDCRVITRNIAGGGTWHPGAGGYWNQLVQFGTCAFGVKGAGGGSAAVAYVGNQDIIDLINESIKRFEWQGKVGASGAMTCQGTGGVVQGTALEWGLYHT